MLLVLLTIQNIWIVLVCATRRVLEKSFLITFIEVNFEAGNERREKFWSGLGPE